MRPGLVHTPYDGSQKPFSIGLSLLDANDWIEQDDHLGRYLGRKDELLATSPDLVFREQPERRAAQAEVLDMLGGAPAGHAFPRSTGGRDHASSILLGRSVDRQGG